MRCLEGQGQLTAAAIPAGREVLHGQLHVPSPAHGLVLFAHGTGSNSHSPRNQRVAEFLNDAGFATLLFDLLSPREEREGQFNAQLRNDVGLLSRRLLTATDWVRHQSELAELPVGYFGASTGAAAAIAAASNPAANISALVTRGGRPDLADRHLLTLRVPTLLIVGSNDAAAALNLEAWARLHCEKSIEIIPGAGHLFEEPGALDNVAALAVRWFSAHLTHSTPSVR